MSAAMKQLEREILCLAEKVRRVDGLELMTTSNAANLLKTSRKWVRENLPLVVLGQKGRRVRVADIEAFQSRRTLQPVGTYFAKMGAKGGRKSRRRLTKKDASEMARKRWAPKRTDENNSR